MSSKENNNQIKGSNQSSKKLSDTQKHFDVKPKIDRLQGAKLTGKRLTEAREKCDMKGFEAAMYLRIEKSGLSHIETGKNYPSIPNLIRLCLLYKVSPDYILGFTDTFTFLTEIQISNMKKLLVFPKDKPGANLGTEI